MDEAIGDFIEFEGRQVKIVKNLKVNVLETSETLLAKKFIKTEVISKPTNNSEEETLSDDKKFVIKPSRVDINPLNNKFNEVGVFYGSEQFHDIAVLLEERTIQNKNYQPVQHDDVKKLGEDDMEIILDSDIEDTESEAIIDNDTSSDPEIIVEEDTYKAQKVLENLRKNACFLDSEDNTAKVCDIMRLRNFLKESETRVRDHKSKIMNLKMSLASMEKKTAEKRLSVQKRDIKIRELEEAIKIKNVELFEKDVYISKLKEENDHLIKFKSGFKLVKKELKTLSRRSHYSKVKKPQSSERNIIEKEKNIESVSNDPTGENAESLSEFLSMITDVKVAGDKSKSKRVSCNTSKSKSDGDVVEMDKDVIDIDIRMSNEKDRYDTITAISRDDLVNEDDENILLNGFGKLQHYPTFSDGTSNIHEGTMDSFLRLKLFASRCANSPNIVKMKSKKRKKLSPSTTFSEGFPTKPTQKKNFSCDNCILVFTNQFELALHKSTYHITPARK